MMMKSMSKMYTSTFSISPFLKKIILYHLIVIRTTIIIIFFFFWLLPFRVATADIFKHLHRRFGSVLRRMPFLMQPTDSRET